MADAIIDLINKQTESNISSKPLLLTTPAVVVKSLGDEFYKVYSTADDTEYDLQNLTASVLEVGDKVLIYYKSNSTMSQSAFIGASASYKPSKAECVYGNYVEQFKFQGEDYRSEEFEISKISFKTVCATDAFISVNGNIVTGEMAAAAYKDITMVYFFYIRILLDGEELRMTRLKGRGDLAQPIPVTFMHPITEGQHELKVMARMSLSSGTVTKSNSYFTEVQPLIYGEGIRNIERR